MKKIITSVVVLMLTIMLCDANAAAFTKAESW